MLRKFSVITFWKCLPISRSFKYLYNIWGYDNYYYNSVNNITSCSPYFHSVIVSTGTNTGRFHDTGRGKIWPCSISCLSTWPLIPRASGLTWEHCLVDWELYWWIARQIFSRSSVNLLCNSVSTFTLISLYIHYKSYWWAPVFKKTIFLKLKIAPLYSMNPHSNYINSYKSLPIFLLRNYTTYSFVF